MEIWSGIVLGLQQAVTPASLLVCFIGVALGTLIGVLPGIGPLATIAMLLPITTSLTPLNALIMLAGIYYGAQYGGSTTAILVNVPGEPSSAVTAIDGYQMARRGRAGAALATAALASFVAGCIATLVLATLAPTLAKLAVAFGAPEYFALASFGLVLTVALSHGSVLKGMAMALTGVLFGLTGSDAFTSATRFTYGLDSLRSGIDFVGIAVGIFGLSEILANLEDEDAPRATTSAITRLMPTAEDIRRSIGPVLRGTALGSVLGVLPGGGAFLSSFASYSLEKKLSRHPEEFGQGAIEGVAGPESANNAGAQASFIPMLTLGIPSNAIMALMIGGMIIQGIIPGPEVITRQPQLFWGLIASMWIGNAMLVVLNLPLVGLWVKLLQVPYTVLFPAILIFACIGTFSANGDATDLYVLAIAGLLGYLLVRFGAEPAPLVLGFVLGRMLEDQFRLAMMISDGDALVFFKRPLSATFMVLALLVLLAMTLPALLKARNTTFRDADT
jgi:putative tricarboxylic transport membrane protein